MKLRFSHRIFSVLLTLMLLLGCLPGGGFAAEAERDPDAAAAETREFLPGDEEAPCACASCACGDCACEG